MNTKAALAARTMLVSWFARDYAVFRAFGVACQFKG
jgi:hypothetical protein